MGTGLISCISDFNIMGRQLVVCKGTLEEVSGLTAPLTFPLNNSTPRETRQLIAQCGQRL